jgi:hypothetical protein
VVTVDLVDGLGGSVGDRRGPQRERARELVRSGIRDAGDHDRGRVVGLLVGDHHLVVVRTSTGTSRNRRTSAASAALRRRSTDANATSSDAASSTCGVPAASRWQTA